MSRETLLSRGISPVIGVVAFLVAVNCTLLFIDNLNKSHSDVAHEEVFDAGVVTASKTPSVEHTFVLRNTTGSRLRIISESHSCTCTAVSLDKVTLEPGRSTPLKMRVNIPDDYAESVVTCRVVTDHPTRPEWSYGLKYISVPRARVSPNRIDLGTRRADGPRPSAPGPEVWLEVYALTPEETPPTPVDVACSDGLLVALGSSPRIESFPGGFRRIRYPISIGLGEAEDRTDGAYSGSLKVALTGGGSAEAVVHWKSVGPISLSPSRLNFGLVGPSSGPREGHVTISSANGEPFRVVSADAGSPSMSVEGAGGGRLPAGPAASHHLTLVWKGAGARGERAVAGHARITVSKPEVVEVRLPWSVFLGRAEADSGVGTE